MTGFTRYSVMLVDDHPMMRRGMRQLLELEQDFVVVGEASRGEEALVLQRALQPDLILLDQKMPHMSGVETLRHLRRAGYPGKVLLYTVSDAEEDVRAAMRHGADGYLLKDMEPQDTLRQVRKALQGGIAISERLAARLHRSVPGHPLQSEFDLTAREIEVLQMIVAGKSNKGIGDELGIAESTVKVHVKNLLAKLGLHSRVEAVVWAMERLRS